MTLINTGEGQLFLATTEDPFYRMFGHAMSGHHYAALVVASSRMAATVRGGDVDGVIFDQGARDGRLTRVTSGGGRSHDRVIDRHPPENLPALRL